MSSSSCGPLFQVAIDQGEMPRPANNGSSFQPKGAVFKAHSPKARLDMSRDDTRPSSVKSDTGVQVLQKAYTTGI